MIEPRLPVFMSSRTKPPQRVHTSVACAGKRATKTVVTFGRLVTIEQQNRLCHKCGPPVMKIVEDWFEKNAEEVIHETDGNPDRDDHRVDDLYATDRLRGQGGPVGDQGPPAPRVRDPYRGRIRWTENNRRVAVAARLSAKILDDLADEELNAAVWALLNPLRPEHRRVIELITEGQLREGYWPSLETFRLTAIIIVESTRAPYEEKDN